MLQRVAMTTTGVERLARLCAQSFYEPTEGSTNDRFWGNLG